MNGSLKNSYSLLKLPQRQAQGFDLRLHCHQGQMIEALPRLDVVHPQRRLHPRRQALQSLPVLSIYSLVKPNARVTLSPSFTNRLIAPVGILCSFS